MKHPPLKIIQSLKTVTSKWLQVDQVIFNHCRLSKWNLKKKKYTYILISDASLPRVQKSVSTDKQREHVGRRNNFAYLLNSFSRLISYTQILVQDKMKCIHMIKLTKLWTRKQKRLPTLTNLHLAIDFFKLYKNKSLSFL